MKIMIEFEYGKRANDFKLTDKPQTSYIVDIENKFDIMRHAKQILRKLMCKPIKCYRKVEFNDTIGGFYKYCTGDHSWEEYPLSITVTNIEDGSVIYKSKITILSKFKDHVIKEKTINDSHKYTRLNDHVIRKERFVNPDFKINYFPIKLNNPYPEEVYEKANLHFSRLYYTDVKRKYRI